MALLFFYLNTMKPFLPILKIIRPFSRWLELPNKSERWKAHVRGSKGEGKTPSPLIFRDLSAYTWFRAIPGRP